MNKEQEKLLGELLEYATDIRNDWSEFDGRDLFDYIVQWISNFRNASEEK